MRKIAILSGTMFTISLLFLTGSILWGFNADEIETERVKRFRLKSVVFYLMTAGITINGEERFQQVRTIGQKGAGPGDFYFPRSLAYFNKKLYIMGLGVRPVVALLPI